MGVQELRARRNAAHHVVWGVTTVGLVAGAAVTATADDAIPFVVPFAVSAFWGCASAGLSILLSDPRPPEGESRRDAKRRRARERAARLAALRASGRALGGAGAAGRDLPPPWRTPFVLAYLALVLVGVGLALTLRAGHEVAGTLAILYPLAVLLGWLSGVCVALIGVAMWIVVFGVRLFGGIVVRGRLGGDPVPRSLAVGPFVATVGLLLLPLALVGPLAYESPYRRDLLPLLGLMRDGVVVTHPWLLLASQAATAVLGLGIAVGYLLYRLARERIPREEGVR